MLTKPWARACAMEKALTKSRQITSSCYGKIPNKGKAKSYSLMICETTLKVFSEAILVYISRIWTHIVVLSFDQVKGILTQV